MTEATTETVNGRSEGQAVAAISAVRVSEVARPQPGAVSVVDSADAENIRFLFPFETAKSAILDIDLVLIFDDGAKIIVPGLALRMISAKAPGLWFQQVEVQPERILSSVGDVQLANDLPQLVLSSSLKQDQQPTNPQSGSGVPVVQLPAMQQAGLTPRPVTRSTDETGENGNQVASTGRFVSRRNTREEDTPQSSGGGSSGGQTQTSPTTSNTQDGNQKPQVTSDGGGDAASLSVAENGTLSTTVAGTDPESQPLTYAIRGGADADLFAINTDTGELHFVAAPDFETAGSNAGTNVYRVTVAAVDARGAEDLQDLTITVTDINERPTDASLSSANVAESAAIGTVVGTVSGIDPEGPTGLAYSFAPGGDANGQFVIDPVTGVIRVASSVTLDHETRQQETVVVRVTDGQGLSVDKTFTLTVTDVNEAPEIRSDGGGPLASILHDENALRVTQIYAVDPEAGAVTYSIVGGADAARFTIDPVTGVLRFVASPNFETPSDLNLDNQYEVTVQASDGTYVDQQTILVDVTDGNEAPTGATLTANLIIESATAGTSVGSVIGNDPDAGDAVTYSFAPGGDAAGRFEIDTLTGEIRLATGATLDFEANPFHTVVVRLTDTGGLYFDQLFVIQVTDTNDAPVIVSNGGGPTAVIAHDENGLVATNVVAIDPDVGTTLTYSIVGGVDAGLFTINSATGVLSFLSAPNFEAPGDSDGDNNYHVTVQVTDGTAIDSQVLTISIVNQNEPPTITSDGGGVLASITLYEGLTAVTTVTATDPDASTTITYSITGGPDQALFSINPTTGALEFSAGPDFELPADFDGDNVYEVIVTASDGSLSDSQTVRVTIQNQNEAPSIQSNGGGATAAVSINEGTTAITTVLGVDPDVPSVVSYSIVGGADQALFSINPTTGALSFTGPRNFEAPGDSGSNNVYDVIVRASDGTLFDDQAIAVTVLDVNEAPTGANLSASTVAENAANGTVIGTVSGIDPDVPSTLTYAFAPGGDAGGRFAINPTTGQITVANGTLLDFEAAASHGVTVRVTDQGGLTFDQAFTITLTGVNETPTITSNGGGPTAALSIAENSVGVITTVAASDPDVPSTLTYSIVGGADQALFTLNPTTGVLRFASGRNFESPSDSNLDGVYDVIVQVSDGQGGTDTQSIQVTVNNVNEAPSDLSIVGTTVVENAVNGTVIGSVLGTDPDIAPTLTYAFAPGGDAGGRFAIHPTTGVITVANGALLDHDTAASHGITVRVTDQGGLTYDEAFTITVSNVNEAPTDATLTGSSIQENAVNGTVVGTVTATDPDTPSTLTYSFAPGGDAGGRFAINPTTGQITVANGTLLNHEANASHGVTVRVTDQGGLTYDEAFTITVSNVNEAPTGLTVTPNAAIAVNHITNGSFEITTNPPADGSFSAPNTAQLPGWTVGGWGVHLHDDTYFDMGTTHGEYHLDTAGLLNGSISQSISTLVTGQTYTLSLDARIYSTYTSNLEVRWNGAVVGTISSATTTWDDFSFSVTAAAGSNTLLLTEIGTSDLYGTMIDNVRLMGPASTFNINEEAVAGTVVATLASADPDSGDILTYTLTGGRTDLYEIVGNQIRVMAGADINYDEATSHALTVRVTDAGGLFQTQSITIDVVDVFNQVLGDPGGSILTGTSGDDFMSGLDGADTFDGLDGDDWIQAGDGDDYIAPGMGADRIDGGGGIDTLSYSTSTAGVTVNLQTGVASGGEAEGDSIQGIENVEGSDFDDDLTGSNLGSELYGFDGNDNLSGGLSSDAIFGGDGNDSIGTGGGSDYVEMGAGDDELYIDSSALTNPLTEVIGGSGIDTVYVSFGSPLTLADLVATMTEVEHIHLDGPGVTADLSNFTAADATSILGTSGPGNTLELDIDDETFSIAAGEHTTYNLGTNTYTFFTDASLTTELARVQLV